MILDSTLRTPSSATVVETDPETTIIAHTAEAAASDRKRLEAAGVELVELAGDDDGRIDTGALLDYLGNRGITALLVEGGATVHGSFFDADLVDEVFFFVAPLIIGGDAPAAVGGLGAADLDMARRFHLRRDLATTAPMSNSTACGRRMRMFTGLIETVGTARRLVRSSGGARLEIEARWPDDLIPEQGDSIAVNGACLTALSPSSRRLFSRSLTGNPRPDSPR